MNLTEFKCVIQLLGWKLTVAQRQSKWTDEYGNSILFLDNEYRMRWAFGSHTTYSYFEDFQNLANEIVENYKQREECEATNKERKS